MRKTQTEKLAARNGRAIAKLKSGIAKDSELHERVRRGELTAGQAFFLKRKTYFCIVEKHTGEIAVESYLSRTRTEEKRIAARCNKAVYFVTVDKEEAFKRAARLRAIPSAQ